MERVAPLDVVEGLVYMTGRAEGRSDARRWDPDDPQAMNG
jgi:hypothetical protein